MKEQIIVYSLAALIFLGSVVWGANFWVGIVYLLIFGSVAFTVVTLIGCGMVWSENPSTRDIFKGGL